MATYLTMLWAMGTVDWGKFKLSFLSYLRNHGAWLYWRDFNWELSARKNFKGTSCPDLLARITEMLSILVDRVGFVAQPGVCLLMQHSLLSTILRAATARLLHLQLRWQRIRRVLIIIRLSPIQCSQLLGSLCLCTCLSSSLQEVSGVRYFDELPEDVSCVRSRGSILYCQIRVDPCCLG